MVWAGFWRRHLPRVPFITTSAMRGDHADERHDKRARLHAGRGYDPEKVAVRILKAAQRNRAVAAVTRGAGAEL